MAKDILYSIVEDFVTSYGRRRSPGLLWMKTISTSSMKEDDLQVVYGGIRPSGFLLEMKSLRSSAGDEVLQVSVEEGVPHTFYEIRQTSLLL